MRRLIGGADSLTLLDADYTALPIWRQPDAKRIGDDVDLMTQFEVSDVSSGKNHTAIVTSDGAVFTWGAGDRGQLGWARPVSSSDPVQVGGALDHTNAVAVACGDQHTLILTEAGDVYACGDGESGQTGLGSASPANRCFNPSAALQLLPKFVPSTLHPTVLQIACGARFSVCVTGDGEVWTWGEGISGALGTGRQTARDVPAPALDVEHPHGPFTRVAAGDTHVHARSKSGRVYTWGLNVFGQLGLGDTKPRFFPTELVLGQLPDASPRDEAAGEGKESAGRGESTEQPRTGRRVTAIAAAGNFSALVTKSGELWTCGVRGPHLGRTCSDGPARHAAARVEALAGVRVSRAACAKGALAVFAPTTLHALAVTSGPRRGGTRLRLRASGAYPSPALAVRFAGDDMPPVDVPAEMTPDGAVECTVPPLRYKRPPQANAALAAARAELAAAKLSEDPAAIEAATAEVAVRETIPAFVTVTVRLSLNGIDFTKERPSFTYYTTPTVEGIRPSLGPRRGGTTVALTMARDYLPSRETRARLLLPSAGGDGEEQTDVASESVACLFNPSTGELSFDTPAVGAGAGIAQLQLAANGVDFETAGQFTLYEAEMTRCRPAAVASLHTAAVCVSGRGLCDSAEACVRLQLPHETITLPASATASGVEFQWPGLDEDGHAACRDACGAGNGTGFTGRCFVSVAVNGIDFGDHVPLGIYHGRVLSVSPPCALAVSPPTSGAAGGGDGEGESKGGEAGGEDAATTARQAVELRVRCDGALVPTAEAVVRFSLPGGREFLAPVVRWEVEAEEEEEAGVEAAGEGKAGEEEKGAEEKEEKEAEEAKEEGKRESEGDDVAGTAVPEAVTSRVRHVAVVHAPAVVSEEEVAAAADAAAAAAEAEGGQPSSRPSSKKGKKGKGGPSPEELAAAAEAKAAALHARLATVSLSLDGQSFEPLGGVSFQFHDAVQDVEFTPASAVAGQSLALSGSDVFRPPRHEGVSEEALRVRFRAKDAAEGGAVVPAEFDEEGVAHVTVPVVEGAGKEVSTQVSYDGVTFGPVPATVLKYKAK